MRDITKQSPQYCDLLVWDLTAIAHKLLRLQHFTQEQYPELIPFLEYVAKHYPARINKESDGI